MSRVPEPSIWTREGAMSEEEETEWDLTSAWEEKPRFECWVVYSLSDGSVGEDTFVSKDAAEGLVELEPGQVLVKLITAEEGNED